MTLLLEHGANVNALGYQNNTALHEAALNKKYECCKFLLECHANQFIRNEFGVMPKDLIKGVPNLVDLFDKYAGESLANSSQLNQSQFQSQSADLNESTMRSGSRRKSSIKSINKKVVLFGTGMKDEDKVKMNDFAKKLNLIIAKDFNQNVTHVIYSTDKGCTRTLNYMKAVLMGIWIVNIKCEAIFLVLLLDS